MLDDEHWLVISELVGDLIAGAVGGELGEALGRLRIGRARAGVVRVEAALKRPGRRWRHGYLDLGADGLRTWVPRLGRRVPLGELRVGRELGMTRAERLWWLDPELRVFAYGRMKLAVWPADVRKVRG
ncbi:hypothetical protein ACGFJ7_22615 [Actinoplanes sp. NPDC048988]|uniref:hypothetical protein n=1 Tax=Actinoplanes sp. NPDC048988 TaxID=3363901 RepID=UPI00371D76A6